MIQITSVKISLRRFSIAGCAMSCLIPNAFIFFKLLIANVPDFEFLLNWIILFGLDGFKSVDPESNPYDSDVDQESDSGTNWAYSVAAQQ